MIRTVSRKAFLLALLASAAVWTALACAGLFGQRQLFCFEGRELLYDFWMPRDCLRHGYVRDDGIEKSGWISPGDLRAGKVETGDWQEGLTFRTGWVDRVYPAFALMPLKAFPDTWTGAWCWTAAAGAVFLLSLVVLAGGRLWPVLFCCSMPFLFNFERGNPVWLSAAFCGIFLAWWDDPRLGRRLAAAACLAAAADMKVAPVLLGALYVPGIVRARGAVRSLAMPLFAAACAAVLFVVPWLFVPDGLAGVPEFLSNAGHHGKAFLRTADFGLVQLWRTVRLACGETVRDPWTGMEAVARLSQAAGLLAVALGAWRRQLMPLVGGFLLAAGNMYYYGALYLLPVFVLTAGERMAPLESLLWFAVVCPLQVVLLGHSGNAVLCNLATMALTAKALVCYNTQR